jgi:hypothetical protein
MRPDKASPNPIGLNLGDGEKAKVEWNQETSNNIWSLEEKPPNSANDDIDFDIHSDI